MGFYADEKRADYESEYVYVGTKLDIDTMQIIEE